jgi:hypothetical protein
MLRWLAGVAFAGLAAQPALATEWVSCASSQGEASFDYLVGSLDVLMPVGLNISVGEKVWASSVAYGPGEPVAVGQAFEDKETVQIDVMDENMAVIIAQLRLFKAEEGDNPIVYSGTLRIRDYGAWTVTCNGG